MKTTIILTSTLLLVQLSLTSQIKTFRLDSIKNPVYRLNILEFQLNVNQSINYSGISSQNTSGTKNDYSGAFKTTYSSIKNSNKYQGSQNTGIGANGRGNIFSDGISNSNSENQQYSVSHSSQNRFYTNDQIHNHFVINPYVYGNLSYTKDKSDVNKPSHNSESRNHRMHISTDLGYGHGRLENISDGRIVLFILEDLQKQGLLAREPNHQEIEELSALAIYVRNKRFFDSRIKRIYELTLMDSLMQEMGLINTPDIAYHTTLQDNWNYSVNRFRQAGWLFQYGLSPSFTANSTNASSEISDLQSTSLEENTSNQYNGSALLFLNYVWQKPISQVLQYNISARATAGSLFYNDDIKGTIDTSQYEVTRKYNSDSWQGRLDLNKELGIYPTNRTYLSIFSGLSFQVENRDMEVLQNSSSQPNNEFTEIFSMQNFSANLGLNSYYFFSPQLRLNVSFSIFYNNNLNDGKIENSIVQGSSFTNRTDNVNTRLNARLVYWLF